MGSKYFRYIFISLIILILWNSYLLAATGSLTNLSASAQNDQAGEESIYTFTYTTSNNGNGVDFGIPSNGKLFFEFEADFDLSQVSVAYIISGMNGGFSSFVDTSSTGLELFIARDGTGSNVSRNATVSLRVGNIKNATAVSGSYRIYVKTMTSANTHIDEGTITGFDINAGSVDYIQIENQPNGSGNEIVDLTLDAGQTVNMYAVGYDKYHNYSANVNSNWSVINGIGNVSPAVNSANSVLTATNAGIGKIAAEDVSKHVDITGNITVNSGNLNYVKIVEGVSGHGEELTSKSLTTDNILPVHAAGYDVYDNYIDDVSVGWSVTGGIGGISPASGKNASFDPTQVGTGRIAADHASAQDDQTDDISVGAGVLSTIKILEGESGDGIEFSTKSLSSGDTLTLHAAGYDADGNYKEDPPVDWSIVNNIGIVTPSTGVSTTKFIATNLGSGFVKAQHATAGSDLTDEIAVSTGGLHHIRVQNGPGLTGSAVQDTVVYLNQIMQFFAAGFDEYGNYIREVKATWKQIGNFDFPDSVVDRQISIQPQQTGLSGRFYADSVGLQPDTTGLIQVGDISYILISASPEANGVEFSETTLSADDSVTLFAAAYDGNNNFVDTVSVDWSVENLQPADGHTGASFIFEPTTANLSGRIIADHAYATDDTTALITVKPGVPVGSFQMLVDSTELFANGSDFTNIYSEIIYDRNNNPISENSQFTIVVKPVNMGMTLSPADENGSLEGHQIKSNAQGKIDFTLISGTVGGTAHVSVSSVNGSAHSDTTILLSEIRIISVVADNNKVSRPQNNVRVQMLIKNPSPEPVDSLYADLKFRSSSNENRRGDYEVISGNIPKLNGGEQRIIDLFVNIKSSAMRGDITIDGIVGGIIQGDKFIQDTSATQRGGWTVQNPPILKVMSVKAPDLVEQGTITTVQMKVTNEGEADASIMSDSIKFYMVDPLIDVTNEYSQTPEHQYPYVLGSGQIKELGFTINVGANATRGDVVLDGIIAGSDVNSGNQLVDMDSDTTDSWEVKRIGEIEITNFQTHQNYAISGQQTPWHVTMEVENRFETVNMSLDSAVLRFYTGTEEISSEFSVDNPTNFQEYGSTEILYADTTETLIFEIQNTTDKRVGNIRIVGTVYLSDAAHSQLVDSAEDQIIVNTPSQLLIENLKFSQTEVTQGQNKDWEIRAVVTNTGSSGIRVDLSSDSTNLSFSGMNDFKVIKPTEFVLSQSSLINSGMTDTLYFTIDSTSIARGSTDVKLQLMYVDSYAQQDTFYVINNSEQIQIQSPPAIRVLNTLNTGPYSPYLNTDQNFVIRMDIENTGDDGAHNIQLMLNSNGGSTIEPVENFSISGKNTDSIFVEVKASENWSFGEIFTANIAGAEGDNSNEFDNEIIQTAVDDTALAILQNPADFNILEVIPEFETIEALSKNWKVFIPVRRNGAESVMIKQPSSDDLIFFINGQPQSDYIIVPPQGFKNSGGLVLSGWDVIEDTLVYIIEKTGLLGGEATIEVGLELKYLNNDSTVYVQDSGLVSVETTANLSILQTSPICPNIEDGIGIISTDQNFIIRVTVQNSGEEPVDDVWVSLLSKDGDYVQAIDSISAGGQSSLDFFITAPEFEKRIDYVSRIDSAVSRLSGRPAQIGSSFDSEAAIQIQNKAKLFVTIHPEDSVMTLGTISFLRFSVENRGTALTDSLGKVIVTIPDNYRILNGSRIDSVSTTVDFITDRVDTLKVFPPNSVSNNDQFRITLSSTPKDINTNLPAFVENHTGTIYVTTVSSDFTMNAGIIWPNGAKDNIVSTEQLFDVQATFQASINIKQIEATLNLGQGYSFDSGVTPSQLAQNNKVVWRVKATNEEHAVPENLIVNAIGYAGTVQYDRKDTIAVAAQKKVQLTLGSLGIISPAQTDSVLSVNQEITISTTVVNDGSAPIVGTGTLKIDFGTTGITTLENFSKTFSTGTPVLWHAKAPGAATSKSEIKVNIETVPFDGNTTDFASGIGNSRSLSVRTTESGFVQIDSLVIVDPRGATDRVLSTNQKFTVRAYLRWNNCDALPTVSVKLPPGFLSDIENKNPVGAANQGVVSWDVAAPSDIAANQNIWAEARANDVNSGVLIVESSNNLVVSVVRQAEVWLNAELFEPLDALDGIVSTGQSFIIKANILKSGDANLEDFYTLRLTMPAGLGYSSTDAPDQRVPFNQSVYWNITAPSMARAADIFVIKMIEPPNDENTNLGILGEAIIEDTRAIPITTEEKSVTISVLPKKANNSVAKGDSSVPMLSLELDISGDEESSHVLFNGIKVRLKDKYGNVIEDPRQAISKISVKNETTPDLRELGEIAKILETESINISFSNKDTLVPGEVNKIEFLVDIAPNATLTDFRLTIDSLSYFDMLDIGSGQRPLINLSEGESIVSGFSVIVPQDFDKAFWNYPNPFGSSGKETTTIQYYLDQDSDIELRVYTLLGDLVWSRQYNKDEPQGRRGLHDGSTAITWGAINNSGNSVLNGVYIAYLTTSYGKTVKTKIAVLK